MVKGSLTKPRGAGPFTGTKSKSKTSGLDSARDNLETECQSKLPLLSWQQDEVVRHHITNRSGVSDVAGVLKDKYTFAASLNSILNFLSEAFEEGRLFNTIAGYRSAISAYHPPIDGVTIGNHPKVCLFGMSKRL